MSDTSPGPGSGPQPGPPPPPPTGPRSGGPGSGRIRRDTAGGMLGGVAAGFARHLDVDVVWIRLAFVAATLFGGGLGIVLYLAAWLIIPEDDGVASRTPGANAASAADGRGGAFWTGVVLVGFGALLLLRTLLGPLAARLPWTSPFELLLPLALIAIGVAVYRSSVTGGMTAGSAARVERDAEGFEDRIERLGDELEQRTEQLSERLEANAERRRAARSRARVAPTTFGLALVTFGALMLANALGVSGITATVALSVTLMVIGIGLLFGAFLGRGRGLIVVGLILAAIVAVATLAGQLPGGVEAVTVGRDGVTVEASEDMRVRPSSLGAVPDTYEFGAGNAVVDLRDLGEDIAAAGTVRLSIAMGLGELRIILPPDVAADLRVDIGIGRLETPGGTRGGIAVSDRQQLPGSTTDAGSIELNVALGVGGVTVTR